MSRMRTPTWQLLAHLDRIHELQLQWSARFGDPAQCRLSDWQALIQDYATTDDDVSADHLHAISA